MRNRIILGIVVVLILLAALGGGWYVYTKAKQPKTPAEATQAEVRDVVEKVGKLIVLPHETPTVATVSDKTKLQGQAFFAQAENGDKVLIYSQSKKAILYRPSANKIIEVAPVNITTTVSPTAVPLPQEIKVAFYNGTSVSGLTAIAETKIKAKIPQLTTVVKQNASTNTYTDTLVVDILGGNKAAAEAIAKEVGGKVGTLPQGEAKPQAAILVILGQNFASVNSQPVVTVTAPPKQ